LQSNFTDEIIISRLQKGGKDFEDTSMYLFNALKGFMATIREKIPLSKVELQDAYSDALVKLIRHLKDGSFRGESKISTYFYRIYYNTCVDVSRKNASNKDVVIQEVSEYDARERDLINLIDTEDQASQVLTLINEMDKTCKRILIDWAYYGYDMSEIAKRSELSSPESARSMKYKCLKKLRLILSEKLYEL